MSNKLLRNPPQVKRKEARCLFKKKKKISEQMKPLHYDSIHESIGSYKFRQLCFFKSSLRNQFQFGSYKFRQWYFLKSSLRNQFQFACEQDSAAIDFVPWFETPCKVVKVNMFDWRLPKLRMFQIFVAFHVRHHDPRHCTWTILIRLHLRAKGLIGRLLEVIL